MKNVPDPQLPTKNYWFPAKRFGWGWGPPRTWQGWVVTVAYVAATVVIVLRAPPTSNPGRFVLLVTLASAVFVLICWATGEPPEWRWGDRKDDDSR